MYEPPSEVCAPGVAEVKAGRQAWGGAGRYGRKPKHRSSLCYNPVMWRWITIQLTQESKCISTTKLLERLKNRVNRNPKGSWFWEYKDNRQKKKPLQQAKMLQLHISQQTSVGTERNVTISVMNEQWSPPVLVIMRGPHAHVHTSVNLTYNFHSGRLTR